MWVTRNNNNKYLGIFEAETIKHVKMKEKIEKENLRRTRKLFKIKLCDMNLKGKHLTVLLLRYSGPFWKYKVCTQLYDIKYSFLIQISCTQVYDIKNTPIASLPRDKTGFFSLDEATSQGEGKLRIQTF